MKYTPREIMEFVEQEDVKFIRLAFCNVYGKQHNVAIMPGELSRAFTYGIAIDASAIEGFGGEVRSDLLLRPDPSTLIQLPWRPEHGKVVRMFCDIFYPDGRPFERDTRSILKKAVSEAAERGIEFAFGAEMEFYLFKLDEYGKATTLPHDQASYMDIAPDDKGEHIRREICLMLEQMGIQPESSHHESGPGAKRDRLPLLRSPDRRRQRHHLPGRGPHGGRSKRPVRQLSAQAFVGPGRRGMHINISARDGGTGRPAADRYRRSAG